MLALGSASESRASRREQGPCALSRRSLSLRAYQRVEGGGRLRREIGVVKMVARMKMPYAGRDESLSVQLFRCVRVHFVHWKDGLLARGLIAMADHSVD